MTDFPGTMVEQIPLMTAAINEAADGAYRIFYEPPDTESGAAHCGLYHIGEENDFRMLLSGTIRECWAFIRGFHTRGEMG